MKPARQRRDFSAADVDRGLTALILMGGSPVKAVRLMHADPTIKSDDIPARETLRDWRKLHHRRYVELQTQLAPQLAEQLAGNAEALASTLTDVQFAIAGHAATRLSNPKTSPREISELSNAARNFATAASLQVDKVSRPIRGLPSSIIAYEDPRVALMGLARDLGIVLEGTATEIDAQPSEISSESAS